MQNNKGWARIKFSAFNISSTWGGAVNVMEIIRGKSLNNFQTCLFSLQFKSSQLHLEAK